MTFPETGFSVQLNFSGCNDSDLTYSLRLTGAIHYEHKATLSQQ